MLNRKHSSFNKMFTLQSLKDESMLPLDRSMSCFHRSISTEQIYLYIYEHKIFNIKYFCQKNVRLFLTDIFQDFFFV